MQISRLFSIVYILLGRGRVTARELAERFEVSVRTIYRDIDALSQAGVPVYATQGAGGGIHISERFVLNKSALTEAEQREILLALQSVSATGHSEAGALLARLGDLFDQDSADWIEVDFSRWGSDESDRQTLADVKRAILQRHPIVFSYHSSAGELTHRRANPVKLLYKSQAWYVQAFCHMREAYRTFKLVRMAGVTVLKETFDWQALPPVLPAVQMDGGGPTLAWVHARLRFAPHSAWRVLDEFSPGSVSWDADGRLIVDVRFPDEPWLASYLLSFGGALEVLEPPSLRRTMAELLRSMLDRYDET